MKIGFNLLLWTGHVTKENFPLFRKLKAVGYDGVEIPIFDTSDPAHFTKIGQALKVTESRVCQIHSKAILHLKARLEPVDV